ncbi:MAG: type II toxin-antitoxin system RelE/ParE family toxin [Candidatus Aminicenantes bacterium]|nr:type II toxin-antitoxin system RelE/ParE family toxin [Candidatus Aminicenantes bacterium]
MTEEYKIEFAEWAESDLDDIVTYIAENGEVSRAVKIYYKLKQKISSLNIMAERGRVVPELKRIGVKEYREIIYSPYRIIYMIKETTVHIIAIFDGRREIADIIFQRITGFH